jgi:hypothetical protein
MFAHVVIPFQSPLKSPSKASTLRFDANFGEYRHGTFLKAVTCSSQRKIEY